MATTHRTRHHQAANVGRHRPQLDPPRFTQAPTYPGRGYQVFPLGPGATPYYYSCNLLSVFRECARLASA
jgi:hypothetical protein